MEQNDKKVPKGVFLLPNALTTAAFDLQGNPGVVLFRPDPATGPGAGQPEPGTGPSHRTRGFHVT